VVRSEWHQAAMYAKWGSFPKIKGLSLGTAQTESISPAFDAGCSTTNLCLKIASLLDGVVHALFESNATTTAAERFPERCELVALP
jgi:hypothetical protein